MSFRIIFRELFSFFLDWLGGSANDLKSVGGNHKKVGENMNVDSVSLAITGVQK